MKKLILILMLVIGTVSYSSDMIENLLALNITSSENDTVKEYLEIADTFVQEYVNYGLFEIDYLSGEVEIYRTVWDAMNKEHKELFICMLIGDMWNKTKSTDLLVTVDYTMVFWSFDGEIYKIRIY